MGRKFHHYHSVSTEARQRASLNGQRRRHGESVVYVDGRPISLHKVAVDMGVKLEQLSERVRNLRKRGVPLTEEAIRRPFRVRASPVQPGSPVGG